MRQFGKTKFLLQLIPRKKFDALVEKWGMDHRVTKFTTWEQVVTHVLAYVLRLESLREVEAALFVPRSTFSDANANRSAGFFEELCEMVLSEIRTRTRSRKVKRAVQALLAIDSSECSVHGSLFSNRLWRKKRADGKKAGVKLHVIWNVNGEWIEDFRITPARIADSPISKQFEISSGNMYVFDRAYKDLSFWWKIVDNGSDFVSRLTGCARYHYDQKIVLDRLGKKGAEKDGVLWDGLWRPSVPALARHPKVARDFVLRRILYRDPESKKIFDFITSDFDSPAQFIADTYKKRWAVELLFRWLKGHLGIRYFASKNPNAIRIQLAVAVLVQLLVQLHRMEQKYKGTLWECLRGVRMNLVRQALMGSGFQAQTFRKTTVGAYARDWIL